MARNIYWKTEIQENKLANEMRERKMLTRFFLTLLASTTTTTAVAMLSYNFFFMRQRVAANFFLRLLLFQPKIKKQLTRRIETNG